MHCFGGAVAQAWRFVGLGFLVSVPCTVTYPNNDEGRRIATELPLESLVVETDSPYLPPQGLRGKRNEPAHVAAAVRTIAELRGITPDEVASATAANAMRVFQPAEVAATR
jgi:TatD DNase family protein